MFSLKAVGALLVIGAMYQLGREQSLSLKMRMDVLRDLIFAFQTLETEISYVLSPLSEAGDRIARDARSKAVTLFFQTLAAQLVEARKPVAQVWSELTRDILGRFPLSAEDLELVGRLGQNLGRTDRQDQLKHILRVRTALEGAYNQAQEEYRKYQGLYRKVGLSLGLILVLLCW